MRHVAHLLRPFVGLAAVLVAVGAWHMWPAIAPWLGMELSLLDKVALGVFALGALMVLGVGIDGSGAGGTGGESDGGDGGGGGD
jgi:hypothetical protein